MAIENEPGRSERDDILTEIHGIGPAAERDLHSIGIRRFSDLIQYTSEELAGKLFEHTQNARYSVALIENDNWIGQAKALVNQRQSAPHASREATRQAQSLIRAATSPDWNPQAEFMLVFENRSTEQGIEKWQTRIWKTLIRDKECDKEEVFAGIEPAPWVNWILEHAQLQDEVGIFSSEKPLTQTPPATGAEESVSEVADEASIDILHIHITEAEPSPALPKKHLVAEVRFRVSGADALLAAKVMYQVELHTINLEDETSTLVVSARAQLQPGVTEYTFPQRFSVPDLGRYELQCIVLLLAPLPVLTIHQGPYIRVIP